MPDPINLRQARKAKARTEHDKAAAQNRVAFGQTKAAKEQTKATNTLQQRQLDGLRLIKDKDA